METRFNSEMLQLARQYRGFSQASLAKASSVTQGYLSKLENGLMEPTPEILKQISTALNFPESYFQQQDRVYGLPISVHAYRKKASTQQKTLDHIQAEMNLRIIHFRKLLKSADISAEFELPHFDIDQYQNDAEEIAGLLRRTWMIPNGPIKNLVDVVERAGILVFICDFPDGSVDGVTMAVKGMPPCIFLNKHQPADRMRFSLAHELGHLVMHRQPSPSMEDEANQFASAFLMPRNDIFYFLKNANIQSLAALKPIWRASIASLLYRAATIGAISKSQSDYMWRQLSKLGYRLREPAELDFEHEKASLYKEIIDIHTDELGYSATDIQSTLAISSYDFLKLYPTGQKPKLQLIK